MNQANCPPKRPNISSVLLDCRSNANDVDLNRNFPDLIHGRQVKPVQPETQAVMDWVRRYAFVLSGSLHGGAMVVNYPYDVYLDPGQFVESF